MTHRSRRTLRGLAAAGAALTLTVGVVGGGQAAQTAPSQPGSPAVDQPELGSRVKEIIEQDGLQFRDLNANGTLDPYEDWRLSSEERASDLLGQMTLEEQVGLMLIDTLNADCTDGVRGTLGENAEPYILDEKMHRLIFRNVVTSPDQAECGEGGGGFQASTSLTPAEAATYMNSVQELSESGRMGLPVLYKSNARNHIDPNARAGINESASAFTAFPKEAGIASAALGEEALATGQDPTIGDMAVVEDFAEVMGAEWESIGLRGMHGYMADLSTEHREVGLDLQRKSAVLLQNGPAASGTGKTLPFEAGASVYVLGDIDPEAVAAYGYEVTNGNVEEGEERPSAEGHDYLLVSMTIVHEGTDAYVSNDPAYGLNPDHIQMPQRTNPSIIEGIAGLGGQSPYGEADACVSYGAESCTDNGLRFGGSFPWESSILDFTGMQAAESWQSPRPWTPCSRPPLRSATPSTSVGGAAARGVLTVRIRPSPQMLQHRGAELAHPLQHGATRGCRAVVRPRAQTGIRDGSARGGSDHTDIGTDADVRAGLVEEREPQVRLHVGERVEAEGAGHHRQVGAQRQPPAHQRGGGLVHASAPRQVAQQQRPVVGAPCAQCRRVLGGPRVAHEVVQHRPAGCQGGRPCPHLVQAEALQQRVGGPVVAGRPDQHGQVHQGQTVHPQVLPGARVGHRQTGSPVHLLGRVQLAGTHPRRQVDQGEDLADARGGQQLLLTLLCQHPAGGHVAERDRPVGAVQRRGHGQLLPQAQALQQVRHLGVGTAEPAVGVHRLEGPTQRQEAAPEPLAGGARHTPVVPEPGDSVGVHHLRPQVGVVPGGIATGEDVREVAGAVARRHQGETDPGTLQGGGLEVLDP